MLVPARILKGTRAEIRASFVTATGEAPTSAPTSPTVTIVDDTGASIVASTPAAATADGTLSYVVPAAKTGSLASWTATWEATLEAEPQTLTTPVEVAGGVLFSVSDVRNRGLDATKFTAELVTDARTTVEFALEDACGVAFAPRHAIETSSGDGTSTLLCRHRRVTQLLTAAVDGVALTSDELATIILDPDTGELYYPTGWAKGRQNVALTLIHGHPYPPGDAVRAGLDLVDDLLCSVAQAINPRASLLTNDLGTMALVTAGVRGAMFNLPSCNALVDGYGAPSFG